MTKITVGDGVYIITEIRREPAPIPATPRRKGLVFLFLVLLGTGLLNVWLSGQYIRTGYRVAGAVEEKRTLQKENDVLRTEMLALSSPSRIDAIARNQLGMVDPRMDGVIR